MLHSSSNQPKNSRENVLRNQVRDNTSNNHTQKPNKGSNSSRQLELSDVDCVSSNAKSSQCGSMLYIFEDNDTVIKMIIKGRSPTMRHVSRNHRVALDWLFDRINLDPKIEIKCVDTKHQLADTLTKGNFSRDARNCLLPLFSISCFSSAICPEAMSKRLQQGQDNCGKVRADVELGLAYCGKLFYSAEFECIKSSGDTQSTQSARFESHSTKCKGNLPLEFQIKMTQRQVLKCGSKMQS